MKRALVTGGSGGIGAAICRQLAQDGLHVLVHAHRNAERARQVAQGIADAGGSAEAIVFDVTDRTAAQEVLEAAVERDGAIQVVVNNAGVHDDVPLAGMSAAQWHQVIDVTLNGFFNVTQPLLLPMLRTRWGRIVNVSSVAALLGNRGQVNYSAAKAGLHGATKSLAMEVGSRGVTVNTVAPGLIASPMTELHARFDPEFIKREIPLNRAGRPEEVADLVSFLVSERAAYVSGQVIAIDGAMS